jgi:hypothetical protein
LLLQGIERRNDVRENHPVALVVAQVEAIDFIRLIVSHFRPVKHFADTTPLTLPERATAAYKLNEVRTTGLPPNRREIFPATADLIPKFLVKFERRAFLRLAVIDQCVINIEEDHSLGL